MSKLFDDSIKMYRSVNPPAQLNDIVNSALDMAALRKRKQLGWYKPLICTAAVGIVFVALLNTSEAFAQSLYKVPVVGSIARVFTFREYKHSDNQYYIQIRVPSIAGTGHTELEKRINREIQSKINIIAKNAEQRAEENKRDIIDNGDTELAPGYFTVQVDYEIKSNNQNTLSFVINDMECYASCYTYQTFYNINLKTGKEISLADMLGEDYKKIVDASIRKQVKERIQKNPDWMYYVNEKDFEGFGDHLKFYINSAGNVVISFDKDEIAPPPMGIQEFEIIK